MLVAPPWPVRNAWVRSAWAQAGEHPGAQAVGFIKATTDKLVDGTSMRITQASDFTAFLASHQYTIHDLIDAMRQKTAQTG